MRRWLILPVIFLGLLASPSSFSQTSYHILDPTKIFITSFFDCPVFFGGRQITVLKNGTRAQILTSTKKWIMVRFWSNGRYVVGWIRR